MKGFFFFLGRYLIDICAWLYLLGLVIMVINEMGLSAANAVLSLVVGLIVFVFIFYLLYLLMSINDNLQAIRKKVEQDK